MRIKNHFKKMLLNYCLEDKPADESMDSAFAHVQEILLKMVADSLNMHKEEIITFVERLVNELGKQEEKE